MIAPIDSERALPAVRDTPVTVLLVEAETTDARNISEALAGSKEIGPLHVEWVTRLDAAIERLSRPGIDVVMLDLRLPDGEGLQVLARVREAAPRVLILALCTANDEALAQQAMQSGAHDYFLKERIDAYWLSISLRYMIECRAVRDALKHSETRFRAVSDASPLGIFVSDENGACVYTNAAYRRISGLDFEQALGTRWSTAIYPRDRLRVLAEWRAAAQGQAPFRTEFRFQRKDGCIVWTRVNSAVMLDGNLPCGYVQTVEDITERKEAEFGLRKAEEALEEERERAQVTLDSIGDAVMTTDLKGNVSYLNAVAERMTGWSCEQAQGQRLEDVFRIIDGASRQPGENPAWRAIRDDRTVALAVGSVLIRRDGSESAIEDSAAPIHNRHGKVTGAVIVFHDMSLSPTIAAKMTHLANHDFLTGLPNRAVLTDALSQAIGLANRHHQKVGLLFIDLDKFKQVNDSLGHGIGDQLLKSVAERMKASIRSSDLACRQGGDEFVVLLTEIEHSVDAEHVAKTLIKEVGAPHYIDGHELHITLSIGICVYPEDGENAEALMRNADKAMFHVKWKGRNNYQFFNKTMNSLAVRRLSVERSLRRALKNDELLLQYQPQIEIASGEMIGAEALLRWRDPKRGLLYPGQFISIAEESGLIVPIGRWVLRETCRQIRAWLDAGLRVVPVAINISGLEFRNKDFGDAVARCLKQNGLPPDSLQLELTESVLMQGNGDAVSMMQTLKNLGVRLAIDDFGTGYSSLSYLKRFPVDTLKIDQSFVRDIVTNLDDSVIVSAVIAMGKSLGLRVVAEGIETQEQLDFLRHKNCDEGQGFLFSHALDDAELALLLEGNAWPPGNRMQKPYGIRSKTLS